MILHRLRMYARDSDAFLNKTLIPYSNITNLTYRRVFLEMYF